MSDTEYKKPANTFTTRDGTVIALKPWTLGMLSQNMAAIGTLVQTFTELTGGIDDLNALDAVVPAMQISLQTPGMLDKIEGFSELMELARAVLEYNEVGIGLGKAFSLQQELVGSMMKASNLSLTPSSATQIQSSTD